MKILSPIINIVLIIVALFACLMLFIRGEELKDNIYQLKDEKSVLLIEKARLKKDIEELKEEMKILRGQSRHIREGWKKIPVRLTHYSVSEEGESSINHRGKKIVNKKGVATRDFPDGTEFYIPRIGYKIRDDNIPLESVKILNEAMWKEGKKTLSVIDVRWLNKTSRQCQRLERKYGRYLWVWVKKKRRETREKR